MLLGASFVAYRGKQLYSVKAARGLDIGFVMSLKQASFVFFLFPFFESKQLLKKLAEYQT